MIYYHGGMPGIPIGGEIRPPCETGHKCASDYGSAHVHRRDRVYLTTDLAAAKLYATMHPSLRGIVYRVEPIGEVESDPDCVKPGLSFQCSRARVIGKIALPKHEEKRIRSAMIIDAIQNGELQVR